MASSTESVVLKVHTKRFGVKDEVATDGFLVESGPTALKKTKTNRGQAFAVTERGEERRNQRFVANELKQQGHEVPFLYAAGTKPHNRAMDRARAGDVKGGVDIGKIVSAHPINVTPKRHGAKRKSHEKVLCLDEKERARLMSMAKQDEKRRAKLLTAAAIEAAKAVVANNHVKLMEERKKHEVEENASKADATMNADISSKSSYTSTIVTTPPPLLTWVSLWSPTYTTSSTSSIPLTPSSFFTRDVLKSNVANTSAVKTVADAFGAYGAFDGFGGIGNQKVTSSSTGATMSYKDIVAPVLGDYSYVPTCWSDMYDAYIMDVYIKESESLPKVDKVCNP